jgi:hypothetical protein
MGANIGSTIGGVAGMAFTGSKMGAAMGPMGMAIGAGIGLVGGLVGGWLGGKKDKKEEDVQEPVVQGLAAIERAQRDTITSITAQTDALLAPEARLLNLPSNFNVPAYMPNVGAGAGSGRTLNIERLDINLNGTGRDVNPLEIRRAVEDALGDVLNDQRRNNGW